MKDIVNEVRALLRQLHESEWRSMHVRTSRYAVFLAKEGGGSNPLLRGAGGTPVRADVPSPGSDSARHDDACAGEGSVVGPAPGNASAAAEALLVTVQAPHLGTVKSLAGVDTAVAAGDVVGQLAVLDTVTDLVSDAAGVVEAVLASAGALVEFDAPLLRIRGAAIPRAPSA